MQRNIIRRLDDPPKILFFSMGQTFAFGACFMVGSLANATFVGIGCGVVAAWLAGKTSSKYHRAFWLHTVYWFFPARLGLLWLPESHQRAFIR